MEIFYTILIGAITLAFLFIIIAVITGIMDLLNWDFGEAVLFVAVTGAAVMISYLVGLIVISIFYS